VYAKNATIAVLTGVMYGVCGFHPHEVLNAFLKPVENPIPPFTAQEESDFTYSSNPEANQRKAFSATGYSKTPETASLILKER
jgi:hypothetical protein